MKMKARDLTEAMWVGIPFHKSFNPSVKLPTPEMPRGIGFLTGIIEGIGALERVRIELGRSAPGRHLLNGGSE